MKVIVCFGEVKVLVPCGDGQILVRELMDKCRLRYTKFTNRNDPENIKVQYLTVAEYGGILDPDDIISDVIDDKERLVAQFVDMASGNGALNGAEELTTISKADAQPSIVPDACVVVKPQPVSPTPPIGDVTDGAFSLAPSVPQAVTDLEEASSQVTAVQAAEPSAQDSLDGLLAPALNGPKLHAHSTSQPASLGETEHFGRSMSGRKSLGAPTSARSPTAHLQVDMQQSEVASADRIRHVRIVNNGRQLGIQVVPYYDEAQHVELGFEVDAVIEGKRVHSENLLSVGDRIVAVNGRSLSGLQYEIAQDIFCKALRQPVLELDVIDLKKQTIASASQGVIKPLQSDGDKHIIELVKTAESLGFSLFVNDGAPRKLETETAICVKNVVPGGVAHRDGRLHIGDRLLEVNGVDVRNHDQTQLVALLRAAPLGSVVRIVVFRALDTASGDLPGSRTPGSGRRTIPTAEVLQLDVALDGVTQTLGLGVNVKARALQVQDSHGGASRDLGIFVNGLVDGGAAQRDGRLRIDDRLIEVNGTSLLNHSNAEAMSLLKSAIGENARRTVCSITIIRTSNAEALSSMPMPMPERNLDAEAEAAADLIYAATIGASLSSSADIDAIADPLAAGPRPAPVDDQLRVDLMRKVDAKLPDMMVDARLLPTDVVNPKGLNLNVNLQPPTIPAASTNDAPRNLEHFSLPSAASPDIRLPSGSGNMQAQAQLQSHLLTPPQVQAQLQPQPQVQVQQQAFSQPQTRLQPQSQTLPQPQLQAQLQSIPQPQARLQSQPQFQFQPQSQAQAQFQPQMQWPPPLGRDNAPAAPIAPLQLDLDVAMQLAKIRGSTESFRLAVDRSHEGGHVKADRKTEKPKKSDKPDKADKAEKQKTAALAAEQTASSSGFRKKKKHGESASNTIIEARVDEPPGAAQLAPQQSSGPSVSAQLDSNVAFGVQLPSTDVMQQQPRLVPGAAPPPVRPPTTAAFSNPNVRTGEQSATNFGAPPSYNAPTSSGAVRSAAPPAYRQPQSSLPPAPSVPPQAIRSSQLAGPPHASPGYGQMRSSASVSRPLANAVQGSAFAPYSNPLSADGRQLPSVSVQMQVQEQR